MFWNLHEISVIPLAYASFIVLDNSFRKHSAIIFQYIYFFLIWTWLFDRQTLVSVCLYTEEPRLATTPFIRPPLASAHLPYSLSTQSWKFPSHFIVLKTSLMRPPRYHDQDFMAQRWSHQRGSTYFLISVFHIVEQKQKKCASAGLWKLM